MLLVSLISLVKLLLLCHLLRHVAVLSNHFSVCDNFVHGEQPELVLHYLIAEILDYVNQLSLSLKKWSRKREDGSVGKVNTL